MMTLHHTPRALRALPILALSLLAALAGPEAAQAQDVQRRSDGSMEARFSDGCTAFYDRRGYRIRYTSDCSGSQLRRADEAVAGYRGNGDRGADAPQVVLRPNGEGEVRFRGDCTVSYRRDGERDRASSSCGRDQRQRADEAMARARLDRGLDRGNWPGGRPQALIHSNGEGEVRYRDGCTVFYRRNGERDHARDACTRDQRRDADEAMARYRHEHGLAGGGDGGWKGNAGIPKVTILETGYGLASYADGCRAEYDLRGDRMKTSRSCTADQMDRADAAMARLRAERRGTQGTGASGSGAPGGRPPAVTVGSDGAGRAVYRDGCRVDYDRRGRRSGSDSACTREQLTEADQAMAHYRREHGLN